MNAGMIETHHPCDRERLNNLSRELELSIAVTFAIGHAWSSYSQTYKPAIKQRTHAS
jgi:hypothetical protein